MWRSGEKRCWKINSDVKMERYRHEVAVNVATLISYCES